MIFIVRLIVYTLTIIIVLIMATRMEDWQRTKVSRTLVLLPSSLPLIQQCYENNGTPIIMETRNDYAVLAYCKED